MNLEARHQLKVPVVRRDDYTLFLEQANLELTFIHCAIHRPWSKTVRNRLNEDWERLKFLHGGPLFALHDPKDHKHLKFLRLFGLSKVAEFVSAADGRPYHIFKTQEGSPA